MFQAVEGIASSARLALIIARGGPEGIRLPLGAIPTNGLVSRASTRSRPVSVHGPVVDSHHDGIVSFLNNLAMREKNEERVMCRIAGNEAAGRSWWVKAVCYPCHPHLYCR